VATRTINWPATVSAVQAILDNSNPRPTQATINSGVVIRNALSAAGATYDTTSNDGILNFTPYAGAPLTPNGLPQPGSVQAWAAAAAPVWVETDRVARAIYKLTPPPSNVMLAAFGMPGVTPWRAKTLYGSGPPPSAVTPTPANGFGYIFASVNGDLVAQSAAFQPPFLTTLGSLTTETPPAPGAFPAVWQCVAAVTGSSGGQPVALPWDVTQASLISLFSRAALASVAAASNPGLVSLITNQFTALNAVLLTQPTPNPSADAASLSAINALNVAIANANAWIAAAAIQ
jgi:hypothetical protein